VRVKGERCREGRGGEGRGGGAAADVLMLF